MDVLERRHIDHPAQTEGTRVRGEPLAVGSRPVGSQAPAGVGARGSCPPPGA
jgi:hypothetical protein